MCLCGHCCCVQGGMSTDTAEEQSMVYTPRTRFRTIPAGTSRQHWRSYCCSFPARLPAKHEARARLQATPSNDTSNARPSPAIYWQSPSVSLRSKKSEVGKRVRYGQPLSQDILQVLFVSTEPPPVGRKNKKTTHPHTDLVGFQVRDCGLQLLEQLLDERHGLPSLGRHELGLALSSRASLSSSS